MVWMAAKLNSGEQKGNSCDFFVAVVATLLSAPLTDFTIWFMNWKKKEKNCRMIKIDSNKLKRHAMYSILFLRFLDQNTESMCDIWAIASYDFPLLPNRKGKKTGFFPTKYNLFWCCCLFLWNIMSIRIQVYTFHLPITSFCDEEKAHSSKKRAIIASWMNRRADLVFEIMTPLRDWNRKNEPNRKCEASATEHNNGICVCRFQKAF